jgi:hypothetical protein
MLSVTDNSFVQHERGPLAAASARFLFGVNAENATATRIDQMHAVANRASHAFVRAGVIGRAIENALNFVSRRRAAVQKRISSHAVDNGDGRQFATPYFYVADFAPLG